MIKKSIVGLVLACAACCSVPLLLPALAGVSVMSLTLFGTKLSFESIICGLALAALTFVAAYFALKALMPQKAKGCGKPTCASNGACGCK